MSHKDLNIFANEVLFPNYAVDEDYLDQQLGQVTGYWANGDMPGIVEQVKSLIDQEIYDLRFTSYYFYGLWVTAEGCALVDVLQSLLSLLQQKSDVWLPLGISLEKKDEAPSETQQEALDLIQTCLGMLFKRIEKRLARFANDEAVDEPEPCRIMELCEQLSVLLNGQYGVSGIVGSLGEISQFHENACEEERPIMEDDTETFDEAEVSDDAISASDKPVGQVLTEVFRAKTEQEKSYSASLQQLLYKIQIFESLICEEQPNKAAIVFEEIQNELDNFNPLRYFPELFSRFAGVKALHIEQLTELTKHNDTVQWQALKEFFLADPESYQALKINHYEQSQNRLAKEPEGEFYDD